MSNTDTIAATAAQPSTEQTNTLAVNPVASSSSDSGSKPKEEAHTSLETPQGTASPPPASRPKKRRTALLRRRNHGRDHVESEGEEDNDGPGDGGHASSSSVSSSDEGSEEEGSDDEDVSDGDDESEGDLEDEEHRAESPAVDTISSVPEAADPVTGPTKGKSKVQSAKKDKPESWDSIVSSDLPISGTAALSGEKKSKSGSNKAGSSAASAANSIAGSKKPPKKLFEADDSERAFKAPVDAELEGVDFDQFSLREDSPSRSPRQQARAADGARSMGRGAGAGGSRGGRGGGGGGRGGGRAAEQYREKLSSDPTFTPRVGQFWGHDERLMDGSMRKLSGWWRGRSGPPPPDAHAQSGRGAAPAGTRPSSYGMHNARSPRGAGVTRGVRGGFRGTPPAPRGKNFKGSGAARSGLLGWGDDDDDVDYDALEGKTTFRRQRVEPPRRKQEEEDRTAAPEKVPQSAEMDQSAASAHDGPILAQEGLESSAASTPAAAAAQATGLIASTSAPEGRWGHDGFDVLLQQGERANRGGKGAKGRKNRGGAAVTTPAVTPPAAQAQAQSQAHPALGSLAQPLIVQQAQNDSGQAQSDPHSQPQSPPDGTQMQAAARLSAALRAPTGPSGPGFAAVKLNSSGSAAAAADPRAAATQIVAGGPAAATMTPPVRLPGSSAARTIISAARSPAASGLAMSLSGSGTQSHDGQRPAAGTPQHDDASQSQAESARMSSRPSMRGAALPPMLQPAMPMLPPGFAMDASGMVYDLQGAQPLAVGYYPQPSSMAMQMQSYYAGTPPSVEAYDQAMHAAVGPALQRVKQGHSHVHGRKPSTIPASAARVAEFRPGSGSGDHASTPVVSGADPAILSYAYGGANDGRVGEASRLNRDGTAPPYAATNPYAATAVAQSAYMQMHYMDPYSGAGTPPAAALAAMYAYGESPAAYGPGIPDAEDGMQPSHGYYHQM
ncbi:hypothetical protein K437DRAFT_254396 [Tilletiaria anomala UBC 951]|uniref:Uncharacterized protein n=1 Tax=Tilletiaria anomala (strain ATCC 24038 / CBS 436.72 / UBC 951) TaxID=1037660 RepID=A0A066WEM1_TILAU|nr:uncharacterized protein K437DRAFT_254396 [Tilletiaria anomala UBC 951]KDN52216.1 hypothetical protein K437DRAFT_254396 [Tilletiaria anomala UBC 951]